jgi:hypothetical protein
MRESHKMRNRFVIFIIALAGISVFVPLSVAQTASSTADISGVWLGDGVGNNRNLLLQAAPMQPWVKAKFNAKGVPIDPDPFLANCEPLSVPRVLLSNTPIKFVQTPGEVIAIYERNHDVREIYTDGREHPKDMDPSWWGHSIAKWDGNTLVVDTVGFNDQTWLDYSGLPHTDALHVIERYTRIDHDTMRLDLTIDDPKAYTMPFTVKRMFKLKSWNIGEDICSIPSEKHFQQGISGPATAPGK